jgi:hypothetical protein
MLGKAVAIRVSWPSAAEPIRAVLVDVMPIGKDVFLRVTVAGRPRLISARAVLELELELDEGQV